MPGEGPQEGTKPAVCADELIVVYAVGGVALHTFDSWFTGVEGNNIVYKCLSSSRQLDRLGRIGFVASCGMRLVNLEAFARTTGGVLGGVGYVVDVVVGRHLGSLGCNNYCS